MPRPKKKVRKKRRVRNEDAIHDDLSDKVNDIFNEALLKSTNSEIEMLSTPFGEIPHSDGMIAFQLKHKKLLFEIMGMDEEMDDPLKRLIFYEKCKDKYPNEPFLENGIAECYAELDREEEHEQKVKENYELFKGNPHIDLLYVRFKNEEENTLQFFHEMYGDELNLAKAYPKLKAFDEKVICDFYTEATFYYEKMKAYEVAKECLEVIGIFEPDRAYKMSILVDFRSDPKKKRVAVAKGIFTVLLLLAVIIGIIWGIVKLFQWIF
ncbi:MAG: hypothetical protein AAF806_02775 [Bacteroidota bacterium]